MQILESIERFLITEVAADLGREWFDPDEDLLEQGVIDSMAVIALITYLEATFGIKIAEEDVVPENFQSVNNMVRFVEQKTAPRGLTLAV